MFAIAVDASDKLSKRQVFGRNFLQASPKSRLNRDAGLAAFDNNVPLLNKRLDPELPAHRSAFVPPGAASGLNRRVGFGCSRTPSTPSSSVNSIRWASSAAWIADK